MSPSLSSTRSQTQSLDPFLEKIIAAYESELETHKRRSEHTSRSYLRHVRNLLEDLSLDTQIRESTFSKIFTREKLSSHLQSCAADLDASSLAQKVSAINTFLKFLQSKYSNIDFARLKLSRPKVPTRAPKILKEDQIQFLRQQILESRPPNEQLLFELLYGSALRISECLDLIIGDVDFSKKHVRILGKGRKRRIVPLTSKALKILEKYPKSSRGPWPPGTGVRTLRRWCSDWCHLLPENDLKIHPHLLRHSLASHLLKRGLKLPEIQKLLGHSRLSTTQRYTHLDLADLLRNYDKSFPL